MVTSISTQPLSPPPRVPTPSATLLSSSSSTFAGPSNVIPRKGSLPPEVYTYHAVHQEEQIAFTRYINDVLKDDDDLKDVIPISEEDPDAILNAVKNGILLW